MSDIDILQEMLKDAAKEKLELQQEGTHSKYSVTLKEPQSDYSVTIADLPENTIVIKVESFKRPREIFQGSKGECKLADFVIISDTGIGKIIVCIEMKRNKGNLKDISLQLTGARCLIDYCQKIGKAFWNRDSFLGNYQTRFVSIGRIPIQKTTTSRQKSRGKRSESKKFYDRPNEPLKIDGERYLQFNELLERLNFT
ncbi:hypothetical protein V0288_05690 [Pannus brasiliensis CCIBt3594]|uniref:Type I restriction enzyme R protein N-terminal domain-containing protein n=1 Tax=Pannus brasiliensis CCIBt3594 TaxID=1427578 RepID=A0AAW9QSG8_9CHRO